MKCEGIAADNPRPDALAFLASAATAYNADHFAPRCRSVGLDPSEVAETTDENFLRLFFQHYGFNRAGGMTAGYPEIALTALDSIDGLDPDHLWDAFRDICDARDIGVNPRMNRGVVRGTAELVNDRGNLIAWVGESVTDTTSIDPAYDTINGISGVGEKIARFFLRDAVWLTGVESQLPPSDVRYLHPMDVWTRRVTRILWPELDDASDPELSAALAAACVEAGESHIAVNQGAWFYPAQRLDGDTEKLQRKLRP